MLAGTGFYSPYGKKAAAENSDELSFYVNGAEDVWLLSNKKESWGRAVVTKPVSVEVMHKWLETHPAAFIAALPA